MSAKYGEYYKPAITAAKGVKTWPVWLTAILAIMPTSLEELQQNWPAVVVLLVATLQPMVQNYWKHSDKPQAPLWVLVCVLAGMGATGCNTVAGMGGSVNSDYKSETKVITHPDGRIEESDLTEYNAESKAGIFGTVDATTHKMLQKWGGAENQTAIGQDAAGIDNSGNAQILTAMTNLVNQISAMVGLAIQSQQTPAELPPVETE